MIYVPIHESLYLLKASSYEEKRFDLVLEYVSWNGDTLGYDERTLKIDRMEGTVEVHDLPMFPLEFSKNPDAIKASCKLRGQRFLELRGVHAKVLKCSSSDAIEALGTTSIQPPVSHIHMQRLYLPRLTLALAIEREDHDRCSDVLRAWRN